VQRFKDLTVWKRARDLVLRIYDATRLFPSEEKFELTRQIRRAAISICANIAEGRGRQSDRDFARFLWMAYGSANELESHLIVARDLGFLQLLEEETLERTIDEVRRMLHGLMNSLK